MDLIEKFVRRVAGTIKKNGADTLVTGGDPLLVEAFARLGWTDPYPLTEEGREELKAEIEDAKAKEKAAEKEAAAAEKATLEPAERAVESRPKGHKG